MLKNHEQPIKQKTKNIPTKTQTNTHAKQPSKTPQSSSKATDLQEDSATPTSIFNALL